MKKDIFLIYWLLSVITVSAANAQKTETNLARLYTLAGKSINYSSYTSEDEVLNLCRIEEAKAREAKNYDHLFIIQQIAANSYCLKGDVGLAIDKAQEMYEEAKELNSELGIALALQAIGNTYMASNQLQQAYTTFEEAAQKLSKNDNKLLQTRLLIQQIHVCMLMEDTDGMLNYLIDARKVLDRSEFQDKENYAFCLQCYQTIYYVEISEEEPARISLEDVRKLFPSDKSFLHLYYRLCSRFHDLTGEYDLALCYNDSTMAMAVNSENLNECKNVMKERASLLEKKGEKQLACSTYDSAQSISNKLNMTRYSKQIDTLRISYWVDQMAIENAADYNRLLRWIVFSSLLLLLVGVMLVYVVRKKNRKLIESRKKLAAARRETEDSIQSKSLFLSNMSHELRTPLNAIVGFADLLSNDIVEDAESKQQLGERIRQNANLLLKLFNDVADLSALKGKNIEFVYDTCDAVKLCRNVVDTVDNVKQTAAAVNFSTSLEELPLYTDPGRLQQVLINLLINATKFTPSGTITLLLETNATQDQAVFTIEDTGCGIPLEKQPHIFERFEKLHEGVQGAGLGLSICLLIVEHVGGKIWIDSTYTKGARFVFTHPLTK